MELTKELAAAAAKRFIESGATNYVGDVYTITRDDGKPSFEVVVTIQKVDALTPQQRVDELMTERSKLIDHLRKAAITLNNRRAFEDAGEILEFLEKV